MHLLRASYFVLLAAMVIALPSFATAEDFPPNHIRVTLLGSGTPVPSISQYGTAILVQAGGENLLFDCGRGCTTRLAQVNPNLIARVDRLFITHLHSDHVVGVDDLWLNGWTQGRNHPLSIWGPKGTKKFMRYLRAAFSADIKQRLRDGVPAIEDGLAKSITEIKRDGIVYEENGVTVTAFSTQHVPGEPGFGYKVEFGTRSIMISGDTTLTENLYRYGEKVDVLFQEVISPAVVGYLENVFSNDQVSKIVNYHTTARQAASLFVKTKPRLAVFYHTKNDGVFSGSLMAEVSKEYSGTVEVGYDLMQIDIGNTIMTGIYNEQ